MVVLSVFGPSGGGCSCETRDSSPGCASRGCSYSGCSSSSGCTGCRSWPDEPTDAGPRIDVAIILTTDAPIVRPRPDAPAPTCSPMLGRSCDVGCADVSLSCRELGSVTVASEPVPWGLPVCSRVCATSRDCACGVCLGDVPFGTSRAALSASSCAAACAGPGDCEGGFRCDGLTGACVPACAVDADCRWAPSPDGFERITGAEPTCDVTSGRCVHPTPPGARLGQLCATDLDCPTDTECMPVDEGRGLCVRGGCGVPGSTCGTGTRCLSTGTGGTYCVAACATVDDCPAGLACLGGTCALGCITDTECRAGETCTDRECVPEEDAGVPDAG